MTGPRRGRRSRRYTPRAVRPKVQWFDTAINSILGSNGHISIDLSASIVKDERKGMKVVRTILDCEANLSLAGTGGLISMGMYMWPIEAITTLADPADDSQEVPWLWKVINRPVFTSAPTDLTQLQPFRVDTRVQRRFPTQEYDFRLDFQSGALSDNVNINGMCRVLVQKS